MRRTPRGLGWRTDFIRHRFDAQVVSREDCLVVRTPHNPGFFWGNFLLLPQLPRDDALAHWLARFDEEIARLQPESRHVAIGIDAAPDGRRLPAWEAAGFEHDETVVMRAGAAELQTPERRVQGDWQVRDIDFGRERDALLELQCAEPGPHEPGEYRRFRERELQRVEAMARAGLARWFGLWCDGRLAADCGLVRDGALGRFQRVQTHPLWRRRGLATALVHAVAREGLERWGLQTLVLCADPRADAIRIYASLGFREVERESGLQRLPSEGKPST